MKDERKHWYFEDFHPGQEIDLGERLVTEEEIVAFARDFDPQPFHVDHEAGAASIYGTVIASGWHTCAMKRARWWSRSPRVSSIMDRRLK